jgi:predicted amidophosphoribosyltransferase
MRSGTIPSRAHPLRLGLGAVAAGLYVPSFEPGHEEHELTQMIRGSKVSREHDLQFAELLAATAMRRFPDFKPDLVVSVPERPGREDRFQIVRSELAIRLAAADGGRVLRQTRALEGYRRMGPIQRRAVCAGRFVARVPVRAQRVLLIDDVVTSGGQGREAIRALIAAGAADWRFAALAQATAPPERIGDVGERWRSGPRSRDRGRPVSVVRSARG